MKNALIFFFDRREKHELLKHVNNESGFVLVSLTIGYFIVLCQRNKRYDTLMAIAMFSKNGCSDIQLDVEKYLTRPEEIDQTIRDQLTAKIWDDILRWMLRFLQNKTMVERVEVMHGAGLITFKIASSEIKWV